MRTHGDIDLLNCHPYEILNRAEHGLDLWLMHNGVLATGNRADITKSDTWHYIQDYLKPMLASNPDFAFHPSFKALIPDPFGCYKTQSKNKQSNCNYKTINPNKWGLDSLEYY
jgi:hypothetical protein